ncbi:MAG: PAS domain S-box protein [Lutibacter sp.]|uniref:PAS domain-containing hybrid sensor histidine kinase/response regulator n=1 Tax=Lutibacter sp. TaxID=1925666 RepID=UPI00385B3B81
MNLKKTFTTLHILLIVLLVVLSVLTLLMFNNKSNVKKNNLNQNKAFAIATKFKRSSNNLTRYCRTSVLTQDSIWEQKYHEVLEILNGKKPWRNGYIIKFSDTIKSFGFTPTELSKFKIAEENLNNLVYTERVAMHAVKGLFDDGTGNFTIKGSPNIKLAYSTLFDENYHDKKDKILEPIEEFFVLFTQRIKEKSDKLDRISYILIGTINALIILILMIASISFFIIKNKIIKQLIELKLAKEKAEEIAKENRKLSVAIAQSANSVIIADNKAYIEYVNPKFTDITGYSLKDVKGKPLDFLNSNRHTKEFHKNIMETVTSGKIWKGEYQNNDKYGNLIWEQITITPIKDTNGEIVNYLGIKEDITNLKRSEHNLIQAQKIAKLGSYNLDLKTLIGKTSVTFNSITGLKPFRKITFNQWRKIVHPDDINNNDIELKKCIKTGDKFDLEYRILTKDTQTLKWIHGLGEISYKDGEPANFIGTIQDITERKFIEQELVKAKEAAEESDRLKTEFLNNMSHEIRTPMNGILGFSEMLESPEISVEKRQYFVKIIRNSGKQLLQIIDDILEISRLGTKQVKAFNENVCLNNTLFELFSIFDIKAKENKTPLYLKKGLSDKESTIVIDKTKLNKVLSNLIENALKFTNEGFIEFGYKLQNNQLILYVKDTGIGIDKEKQELIFGRFSQAEKELSKNVGGLGLGLSIAKENTELLGGKIFVESVKGKGATFFMTIPYHPVYNNLKESEKNIKSTSTILIAEDEEVNYLFLETLLVDILKLEYTILHAKNGVEAIEMCKTNPKISMVLMDLKMPVMSGYEATKKIREFLPKIPIIAQTAYSTKEEEDRAIEAGCNEFISKPINKEMLFKIIENYLK